MPRMSREKRLEWSFFLNHRNRIAYNALCRSCTHGCKQSFRAIVVLCPRYWSKRWKPPDGGPKQTPIHGKGYPEPGQPQKETPARFTTGSQTERRAVTIRSTPGHGKGLLRFSVPPVQRKGVSCFTTAPTHTEKPAQRSVSQWQITANITTSS